MLNNIKSFLNKPFPSEDNPGQTLKSITLVSLFVTFFLFIFQPFGLASIESNRFLICLGFGAATFISYFLYELFSKFLSLFKKGESTYTFGKWIVNLTGLMLCISLANFFFVRIAIFGEIRWEFFPDMIRGTFSIGIFPTIFIGGLALLRQEKKYQKIADEINEKEHYNQEKSVSKSRTFEGILLKDLRYFEALQNYVKIGYVLPDGQIAEKTVRISLKNVLELLNHSSIVKCHRSYLVNRSVILSTSGNAQGLLLTLEGCEKLIPVSRSFVSIFK